MFVSPTDPDTQRIQTFDCINFDKDTGLCKDYKNRPNICRNTSCIKNSSELIDEQYKKTTEVEFLKIDKK